MKQKRSPRAMNLLVPLVFAAIPVVFVAVAFLLPYGAALFMGFSGGIKAIAARLADPALGAIIRFTILQALLSTAAALALGLPGAWLLGTGRFKGAALVRSIAALPFAMPPILVVLGFVLFFGNSGWLNQFLMIFTKGSEAPLRILYRPAAIILAHAFYNFPIVLRLVGDSLSKSRAAYASAAAILGASPAKTFVTVLLPLALPSITASILLVFLYCFTSFAIVLVLGGGPATSTLPVEIYRYARVSLDFVNAGTLAAVETSIAILAFLCYIAAEKKARMLVPELELRNRGMEKEHFSKGSRILALVYLGFAAVLVLGPLLTVPLESFLYRSTRAGLPEFSLRWWQSLGSSALPALGRSLLLAAVSASLATLLALLGATARFIFGKKAIPTQSISFLLTAPLVSSGIVLGLGWLRLYGSSISRSFMAVAIVHGVAALPFAYRSISEGFQDLPSTTLDAASVFGAGPLIRVLTVALPASVSRIRSAWSFAAVMSLGELNAVLMLGLENWETLPLLIYRAAGAYRFGSACAAGTLLTLSFVAAFFFSEFLGGSSKRMELYGY